MGEWGYEGDWDNPPDPEPPVIKLWLDDMREPPDYDWEWAQSFQQVLWYLHKHGAPDVMSFDHDLGHGERTGYEIIKWIVEREMNVTNPRDSWYPKEVRVHSANPIGAENIRAFDKNWRKHLEG